MSSKNYFLYSHQPLNGEPFGTLLSFEPHRYSTESEARKYAHILGVLKHTQYYIATEDEVRNEFGLIQDAIPLCSSEQVDECGLFG